MYLWILLSLSGGRRTLILGILVLVLFGLACLDGSSFGVESHKPMKGRERRRACGSVEKVYPFMAKHCFGSSPKGVTSKLINNGMS